MIPWYQKMISQGIIPDILISANAVPRVNIYLLNSPISQRFFPYWIENRVIYIKNIPLYKLSHWIENISYI